jgi:hypothetical protein
MTIPVWVANLFMFIIGCSLTANVFQALRNNELKRLIDGLRHDVDLLFSFSLNLLTHARQLAGKLARAEGTLEWIREELPETLKMMKAALSEALKSWQSELAKDVRDVGEGILRMAHPEFTSQDPANDAQCSEPKSKDAANL